MKPTNIKTEYITKNMDVALHDAMHPDQEPIMTDVTMLCISWDIEEEETDYNSAIQNGYRIAIYRNGECLYETGRVGGSDQFCEIPSPPERIEDDDFLFLSVTLWDGENQLTDTVSYDL